MAILSAACEKGLAILRGRRATADGERSNQFCSFCNACLSNEVYNWCVAKGTHMATPKTEKPYRVISGIGAGAGAGLVMMAVMGILRLLFNVPTIPELMVNPIVRFMGGQAFSDQLDRLYYAGRPLLFTSILEGTLLLGVLLGLLYAWLARPNPATGRRLAIFNAPQGGILYGLVIGVLLNVGFLPILGQDVFANHPTGIYAASPIPLWAALMLLAL